MIPVKTVFLYRVLDEKYTNNLIPFKTLVKGLESELNSDLSRLGLWYDDLRRLLAHIQLSDSQVVAPDFHELYEIFLSDVKLIRLDERKNINYPPFHYLIESATLGTVIKLVSEITIDENDILKLVGKKFGILNPKVFISYLLRFKELRNRCAHNGRIFNRNYRSVKAIGKYKNIRKDIYDHRLLDVYYTLYFLLGEEEQFKNSSDLEKKFIDNSLNITNENLKEFILNCLRKN